MSAVGDHPGRDASPPRQYSLSIGKLQRGVLWLFVFCGCFALFEPSPYEAMFVLTVFVFMITGLRINAGVIPLMVLLLIFNVGAMFSIIPYMDDIILLRWLGIGVYLMFTAFLFAALMSDDAEGRIRVIRRSLVASAWLTSMAGIAGYFDIAGLSQYFTLWGRASGTFKDPNIFGPYLVLPIIFTIQGILLRRLGLMGGLVILSVPLLGVLLSFSRGAWGNLIGATLLLFLLTFLTTRDASQRMRIIGFAALIVSAAIMALLVVLSFEEIREVFNQRASLSQPYDLGVQGRFGSQARSIGMLLELPNGFGPLRFSNFFPEAPHNVYLNAFSAYGWMGGIAFMALVVSTMFAGWTVVFRRSPLQNHAIAVWSVLFITLLQGVQIDLDHWRHVYLLLGLIWGLAAVSTPNTPRLAHNAHL